MGYARTSIGTPDESSGKNKVDAIPYTLQLNIFQIAQQYKQPHQKHRQKTYNHENSQWELKKHLRLIKDILKIKENLKSLKESKLLPT